MKSSFAKILMLSCLVLVLALKALTLLSASDSQLLHSFQPKTANSHSLSSSLKQENRPATHVSQSLEKNNFYHSAYFEEGEGYEFNLKKEFKAELLKIFSSFAKFALSSRIHAFQKSYSALLSTSEHKELLFVLDRELLI